MRRRARTAPSVRASPLFRPTKTMVSRFDREKENREKKLGGEPASADCYCAKLKSVCKFMIIR